MELAVSSQISAPKISASGKILSTSVQADSSPNTVGAGSKQLSLSGFFMKSNEEMELVLPCTPSGMNGSKRKRKATPDEKKTPKGTGGKGKPLAKSGKKIIENTISKVQSLILVSDDSDPS